LDALKEAVTHIRNFELGHKKETGGEEVKRVGRYEGPTLFVGGGRSHYIRPEAHGRILELFPKAKIEIIADAGHWVHFEKPNEFIHIVQSFLAAP
jgi:esterase